MMHPRLTVFGPVFGWFDLDAILDGCARAGASRVGLRAALFEGESEQRALDAVRACGLQSTHLVQAPLCRVEQSADRQSAGDRLCRSISVAAALGAGCVYGTTGSAQGLEWEDAADAFCAAVRPAVRHADAAEVRLLIEPTNVLFADLSFVHSLRDTVDLAESAGIGVCVDVQHCWAERNLRQTIRRAGDRIGLVQLSDLVSGRHAPFRAVPGDGIIPLERIISWVLDTGYKGLFDLELTAEPDVDPAQTVAVSIDRVSAMFERLGV